jgi:hypothetical protein
VIPLLFIVAGLAALAAGSVVLRRYGPRYRVGRLLAATPILPLAELRGLVGGRPIYVGVEGRIDAEDEFEDMHRAPLVFRRARVQVRQADEWVTVDEHRQAVDFEIRQGLDAIAIDHAALDEGLVVVLRESVGTAADVADRVPAGTPAETPARLRVEQVSSVEHAIVLGVPVPDPSRPDGVRMTAGLGRPLVLTTLERPEAMRVLAEGRSRRPLAAALLLAGGLVLLTVGLALAVIGAATGTALAASPSPTPALGGDPRSSGEGPGLVGDPLLAIGLVLAIGLAATVATLVYLRLTGHRQA